MAAIISVQMATKAARPSPIVPVIPAIPRAMVDGRRPGPGGQDQEHGHLAGGQAWARPGEPG